MTPPKRIIGAVAVATAVALAAPGAAGASKPGDRTFQQTFPVASALCAKVAAGTEGPRLKANLARVTADCATLQALFTPAQAAVLGARAAILPTLTADRTAVKAACPNPKVVRGACAKAHKLNDAAIASLRHQLRAAYRVYFKAIEAARRQFWAEIHAIRGERHHKADAPIAIPPA